MPPTRVASGRPPTPAAQSGIQPGDASSRSTGSRSPPGTTSRPLIRANLDHPALLSVERDGQRVDLTPVNTVITGVPDKYDPSKRIAAGFFGVEPVVARERGGPLVVLGDMWQMTKQTVVALADFPVKVFYTGYNLVTGKPRDIYGPMSIVGASRAAGRSPRRTRSTASKIASLFTVLGVSQPVRRVCSTSSRCSRWTAGRRRALYEAVRRAIARLFETSRPRARRHRAAAARGVRGRGR